ALERGHAADLGDAFEALEVRDEARFVARPGHLELQLRLAFAVRAARDVRDVRAVLEDRLGDPVQDARFVTRGDQQAEYLAFRHAQKINGSRAPHRPAPSAQAPSPHRGDAI